MPRKRRTNVKKVRIKYDMSIESQAFTDGVIVLCIYFSTMALYSHRLVRRAEADDYSVRGISEVRH